MISQKPRLAADMDDVIADAHGALGSWYAETYGYQWSPDELNRSELRTLVTAEHAEVMEAKLRQGDVFGTFSPMPGSQAALASLFDRFEIFIATAAMDYPAPCASKFSWLQEHFPFIPRRNIVFCGDKSIIAADLLLDDSVRHFVGFRGQGVLFAAPHNLNVEWPCKLSGWDDARRFLSRWEAA